ncbi:hypothetical protein CRUP_015604 [Coryphaenoides rupestris]|nr:hypothetical protein CRUP_015604 [Coryphaenoides rupestris]
MSPVAMTMLEEDELLSKMRFHLVPKQMTEEAFWRNYFYRVSLIKQSAQISLLAAQRPQTPETQDHPDPDQHKEEDVVPDWEKELHEELQVYELVAGAENHNDRWDKELEDMLREDL